MEYFIFLFVVLKSCIADAFLTNSTGLTSFEFQQLSQMINNEGLSRHHVENEVTSLEQRVAEIENDLKTKYDEKMNDFKAAVEKTINATNIKHEADIVALERQNAASKAKFENTLNLTRQALEQELNITKQALEHQSHALEKEKSNSRQLEREYTRLMIDFRNLSMKYDSLVAKETDLSSRMESINGSHNLLQANVSRMNAVLTNNSVSTTSNAAKISSLTATTAILNTKAGEFITKTRPCNMQNFLLQKPNIFSGQF